MKRREIMRAVKSELAHLNALIDFKIIRGQGYGREARRHKLLLGYVRAL